MRKHSTSKSAHNQRLLVPTNVPSVKSHSLVVSVNINSGLRFYMLVLLRRLPVISYHVYFYLYIHNVGLLIISLLFSSWRAVLKDNKRNITGHHTIIYDIYKCILYIHIHVFPCTCSLSGVVTNTTTLPTLQKSFFVQFCINPRIY